MQVGERRFYFAGSEQVVSSKTLDNSVTCPWFPPSFPRLYKIQRGILNVDKEETVFQFSCGDTILLLQLCNENLAKAYSS